MIYTTNNHSVILNLTNYSSVVLTLYHTHNYYAGDTSTILDPLTEIEECEVCFSVGDFSSKLCSQEMYT